MSDNPDSVEPFNHGGYREDIDRNGDGIPDRMQQGYDSSTGNPLDQELPPAQRFDLQHVDNVPVSRNAREALMSLGASYDNAEGNSRNPESRSAVNAAVKAQSATEQVADSTVGPNFNERVQARALWERRKHMPQKEAGLLKNLRQIQSAPNEPKTGLEIFQSLGHGISGGFMIGARQAVRNREIRLWKENEEFLLEVGRGKDRDALLANDSAKDLRDTTQGVPDDGTSGPASPTPESQGPTGGSSDGPVQNTAESPSPEVPAVQTVGPVTIGDIEPAPAANDQSDGVGPAPVKFAPQEGLERQQDGAADKAADQIPDTSVQSAKQAPPAPEREAATAAPVTPGRANANVAAGAAVSVVAPVAAPLVTAAATHQAQREAGGDFRSTAKGPAAPSAGSTAPTVSVSVEPAQRKLGVMPDNSMRIPASAKAPVKREGALYDLAASIKDVKGPVLSKGSMTGGVGRRAVGLGLEMASKILIERQASNVPVTQIKRDSTSMGR